ncbi:hypothetical protein HPB49_021761 [Dermacentor silvarum]|uniref:Uncharacterized protein n=1 Tax=Dermacentor silvarum TaxID=543639 RepID=A0ACB8CBF9_DERSI|nr:hypothetical protein HPB49_021761 [Dermacentor silvarum]
MDDAELDIDALDELLGQELMEAEENKGPSKTISDTCDRKSENEPASTAAIEKQLREMQEKMDILRRQLENQKSSRQEASQASVVQAKGDSTSKNGGSGSSPSNSVSTRRPLKLVDEDIFSAAKDDGKMEPEVTSIEKSVVHSGDTDSSDDEKRYPTEAGLSKLGKSIKRKLEERKSSDFHRGRLLIRVSQQRLFSRSCVIHVTYIIFIFLGKDSKRKGTLPLDGLEGSGVRDPYSGIRIIRPVVSSTVMEARMSGRKMVKMSMVPSFVQQKKIDIDWVTVGVLVNKTPPKTSKNCVEPSAISQEYQPYSCEIPDTTSLVDVLVPCTDRLCELLVRSTCPYCVYHVKAEYRKMSSKRTDLQASLISLHSAECSAACVFLLQPPMFIYGGRMFMNPTREATKTLRTKDKLMLSNLKVARQAEEIEKTSRHAAAQAVQLKHLSSSENQAINAVASKSDFLGKALCNPGAGSRNFLRHVVHETDSTSSATSSKKEMISITAKDLLKMHNGSMKSPAGASLGSRRTAPALQAKGLGAVSPISSGSVPLPRLTALTPSEIAKLRAAQKLNAKAPLVKQDPNAVKKDTTSSEVQAKIQRKLEEPPTSREETRDDELVEMPAAKKSRLGPALTKEEVERLLRQKSSHAHQVDDIEQEQEEQYFSVLEKKEQLEEKMLSVTEIQCDVVSCRKHHKAMKRFFRCKDCSHRTFTFARVPALSCRKCNGSNFERTSMGKPKPGPMLDSEKLLIRGEEVKYLNK